MPDLNLDLDYFTHPKTTRLIGLLGKGAEVLPIRLWCYCGKYHAKDGRLTGYSTQEIESIVGWWGKEGELMRALVKVGFIQGEEEDYQCHDWMDYQGHIQALKDRNKKVAKARWDKIRDHSESTTGIPDGTPKKDSGMPQPTNLPTNQPTSSKEGAAGCGDVDNYPLEETLLQQWGRQGKVGSGVLLHLVDLTRKHGWERMEYAIKEAAGHGACNLAYVKGILEPRQKLDEVVIGNRQDFFAFQGFLTGCGKKNGEAFTISIVTEGKEWKFAGAGITELHKQFTHQPRRH